MTKGHLIFAQNSDVNYIRQAYALALSIKKHNTINSICLVTNGEVEEKYKKPFDYIKNIPFGDLSVKSVWKIENRWQLIYTSPFDETIVYDSDMLLLNSNDYYWEQLKNQDLVFTEVVKDYRGNTINDKILRKCFIENRLPNVYFGLHYFKKTNKAFEFYKWLEIITKDYKAYYNKFTPKETQPFCSMDVSSAIATKIIGNYFIPYNPLSFIHMKRELQGWNKIPVSWHKSMFVNFTNNGQLYLSNILQQGVFHYTEDEFLTDEIITKLENL